jgi:hypothetical protein
MFHFSSVAPVVFGRVSLAVGGSCQVFLDNRIFTQLFLLKDIKKAMPTFCLGI